MVKCTGVVEAIEAGQVFRSHGLTFRKCYASLLTRSIVTAQRALEAAGVSYTPLEYEWRLNERHYGALQGLSKERTAVRLGREKVMAWRRSYDAQPPLMTPEHPHFDTINDDARYRHLDQVPLGESLEDCQTRVVKAWNEIVTDFSSAPPDGSNANAYTLVVAHANSLRALVMHLDDIPAADIESLNIPTAIPFYYDIDLDTGKVVSDESYIGDEVMGGGRFRGVYISDERKKRSFLERRRAANDPWLWALHDHQVAASLLLGKNDHDGTRIGGDQIMQVNGDMVDTAAVVVGNGIDDGISNSSSSTLAGLDGIEEEARQNTRLFSGRTDNDDDAGM